MDEHTSASVARDLRKLGFKDVKILKGGLGAWTNAGLPIETRSDLSQVGGELYKAVAGGAPARTVSASRTMRCTISAVPGRSRIRPQLCQTSRASFCRMRYG